MPSSNLPKLSDSDEIAGKTFLLRGALNVPIQDGRITEDFRLRSLLPTISWLTSRGARVVLVGHLSGSDTDSFQLVADYLGEHMPITFVEDYVNGTAQPIVDDMQDGDVVLFENLRRHPGEKENDTEFAKMLANYADAYVNDAFPAAHRPHASVIGVPQHLPSFAGKQFVAEVENLTRALDPRRPFVFILGGAKFATKLPLAEKFTSIADEVFVAGAVANAYLQADGYSVGESVLPEQDIPVDKGLESSSLRLPSDVVCQTEDGTVATREIGSVQAADIIVDVGHQTVDHMKDASDEASMVVWNGPLGWYEKGYDETTDELAEHLSGIEGETILGGGDTAAVVLNEQSEDNFSFVSTAGGAMVEFLANETLPGIEALIS